MKKFFSAFVLLLILPFALNANPFQQGVHYEVVAEQASEKPEVKEYFSFYCGACNSFEPLAQRLAKQMPEGVEFKKIHVDFIRAASPEIQNTLTRAYLVAQSLGKGDQVSSAIFNQIHRSRAPFTNERDVRNLVLIHDIDSETYDKAMKSFSVMGAARQMKKEQDELSEKRIVTAVPTLIVNGKYRLNIQNLNNRNLQNELLQLIEYLLQKDA